MVAALALVDATGCAPGDTAHAVTGTSRAFWVSDSADPHRLSVRVFGTGPDTVVVLHGGPGLNSRYLISAFGALLPGRTLVFYDQRGRGESAPVGDSAGVSLASDVADLDRVRAALRLSRMTVIADGAGAQLAVSYSLRYPHRVARVAAIAPPVVRPEFRYVLARQNQDTASYRRYNDDSRSGLQERDPAAFCRRHWTYLLSPALVTDSTTLAAVGAAVCSAPPRSLRIAPLVSQAVVSGSFNADLRDSLARIRVDFLLVQGRGESAMDSTLARSTREWRERLPRSRLLEVAGPAQMPWIHQPAEVFGALRAFLDGGWPKEAR